MQRCYSCNGVNITSTLVLCDACKKQYCHICIDKCIQCKISLCCECYDGDMDECSGCRSIYCERCIELCDTCCVSYCNHCIKNHYY